jgi:diacylglycerol kinase (ATP)
MKNQKPKVKLIYNPHAGLKRKALPNPLLSPATLEDLKELLNQYQIEADFYPTKHPGHATTLAKEAQKQGYQVVLVAGGDGTVGEVANGLIGTKITLGVLPLGSIMNVARMLNIPNDLEKAILLIKLGQVVTIDLGKITLLGGQKLLKPHYFMESMGLGLEAQLHENIMEWEKGDLKAIIKIFKTFLEYYGHRVKIFLDNEVIETKASLISISNGPFTGAAIPLAPKAKLDDHLLTVSLFRMTKFELVKHFLTVARQGKTSNPKISTFQTKKVRVESRVPRLVHADARLYGNTPLEAEIFPQALRVYTGFYKPGTLSAFTKKTYLAP